MFKRKETMHPTKNGLAEPVRKKIAELCNARLADTIDLYTQVKTAHWNVKGPQFIALHELFDEISGEVLGYMDDIAERAVQLGGDAEGTVRTASSRTTLPAYPAQITRGSDHVEAISSALAQYGNLCREAINYSDEVGDKLTADLFTGIGRGIDKSLWFVESHANAVK